MTKRKTIKIKELVDMVNQMNEESTCPPELRVGWNCFVEGILEKTGTYEGYIMAKKAFDPQTKEIVDDSRRHYCLESSYGSRSRKW